ncbi:ABC1-domain-containing protein [Marasmius fiardii PR-910]|nr:ABC1-domain-containing protein [Marasmius fiardii PR-910]
MEILDEVTAKTPLVEEPLTPSQAPTVVRTRNLQSSKVPSSRIGRLFHYGGLAASLGYGVASEMLQRSSSQRESGGSVIMTEANIKRLVGKLSQMRGAALKLGQFLSIQDTHLLPPELDKIFRRVQDSAHYMPDWQMEALLIESLGSDYSRHFVSFDRIPFAAASIGQVHSAVLTAEASPTGKPAPVAVKIQFPNISASISSDIGYIKMLLTVGKLLPKGLFLDRTIQVMKQELAEECDYKREASFLRTFGSTEYLGDDKRFKVPWVWDGSTETVLVMERVDGVSVGESEISELRQEDRNEIASRIILLCLKELFEFRMMQTDPNYTNFLYNERTRRIELVDFGATRVYSKTFMDRWLRLLQAAAEDPEDREACIEESLRLGYLTGQEDEVMLNAHVKSMTLLATPFKKSTKQPFGFGPETEWETITKEIRSQIPVMLQHRLTPPPRETYSLNRKLSGAFLLASRLRAVVDTKAIWDSVVRKYRFD